MKEDENLKETFFDKYKVQRKLGQGSFGLVYLGIDMKTNEQVAIKLESRDSNQNLLEMESYRLIYMKGEGVPKVYCYGNNKKYNILVLELLGKSLEELFNICHRKFTLKTVCVLGVEMIKRIRYVHQKNHIHRDIKPDNFMMGTGNNENKLYIIDFGLSKKFRSSSKQGQHILFRDGKKITGTARYCSISTHKGYEQSRRDDIESIGYVLIYFLNGSLPWQGLKCKPDEDQYEKIGKKKIETSVEELCKSAPKQFMAYFRHVRSLSFEDEPDYDLLLEIIYDMIQEHCLGCKYDFDWNNKLKSNTIRNLDTMHSLNLNEKREKSMLVNNNLSNLSPTVIESQFQFERLGVSSNKKNSNLKLKLRSATQVEKNVKFNLEDEDLDKSEIGTNNMNVISSEVKATFTETQVKEREVNINENDEEGKKENGQPVKQINGKPRRKETTACKCIVF